MVATLSGGVIGPCIIHGTAVFRVLPVEKSMGGLWHDHANLKSFLQSLDKTGALINGLKGSGSPRRGRSTSSNGFVGRFHALISRAILSSGRARTKLSLAIRLYQASQDPERLFTSPLGVSSSIHS